MLSSFAGALADLIFGQTAHSLHAAAMANHSVAVAKASLIAPFVRPDPTSIPRDEVTAFHGYLETAIERCSPSNIQV